jgi:hypothetical protein
MGELHDFIDSSRSARWVSKRVIARQRTIPTRLGEATEEKQALRFLKHHFPVAIILIAAIVAGCCGKSGTTTPQTPTATPKGGEDSCKIEHPLLGSLT